MLHDGNYANIKNLFFVSMWCRKVVRVFALLLIFLFPIASSVILSSNSSSSLDEMHYLKTADSELFEESRRRKKKGNFLKSLLFGAILVKMILFPLAVKAMAVMSSVSVFLSTMSLIMSSIVGYAKLANNKPTEPTVKLVHVKDIWAKGDDSPKDYIPPDNIEYSPSVPLEQIHYQIK